MKSSIVEYFAEHESYRCGYCKSPDTNYSHGMWAHSLRPADYQGLLNRGWRRSGKYLYKPTNSVTCCPMYTINCHALEFTVTKSQKKVLKRFNHYLQTGSISKTTRYYGEKQDTKADVTEIINYREGSVPEVSFNDIKLSQEIETSRSGTAAIQTDQDSPKRRKSEANSELDPDVENSLSSAEPPVPGSSQTQHLNNNSTNPKSAKFHGQKSKVIRLERKRQKLIAKGLNPDELIKKGSAFTKPKPLEFWIQPISNAKVNIRIKLVKTDSEEFESSFNLEHSLYQKYQIHVHKDEPSECTRTQFRRFLCDNPLNEASEDHTGAYHQQYYLNDKLIAVGVIDLLPSCLSSVYFFYDPDQMFLSLGVVGALREIGFVRELSKIYPSLQNYYMGFYIHSCQKMRYKGSYSPSYLLCPETYKWKLLDDELRNQLSKQKYSVFFTKDESESGSGHNEDINKVRILYRKSVMPYSVYTLKRNRDDTEFIQQFCNLVSAPIAEKLFLYRSSEI